MERRALSRHVSFVLFKPCGSYATNEGSVLNASLNSQRDTP